jgi:hypothetical protein
VLFRSPLAALLHNREGRSFVLSHAGHVCRQYWGLATVGNTVAFKRRSVKIIISSKNIFSDFLPILSEL